MSEEKILLVILPVWNRLIPPLGISCIKGFLQTHGYDVKTVDANIENELNHPIDNYLNTLKMFIPGNRNGNFFNIVHQVMQNHTMAHFNYKNKREYVELVKVIVYKTFFCGLDNSQVMKLDELLEEYVTRLRRYFLHLLETERPTVLGLSVYSSTLPSSLAAFKLTRETDPGIKTVMGGGIFTNQLALGSINLKVFLEKTRDYIDHLIVGEGELLLLKYLNGQFPGYQRLITPKHLNGSIDQKSTQIDLSLAEKPDFSDFDLAYYNHLAIYGSRGCPFNCNFCSETILWGKYRKKNGERLAEELITLSQRYDFQLFLMCDSLLNPIVTDLARELVKAGVSIYWDGYLRADSSVCNRENTLLWRQGGFYRARLGLESGSQRILDLMGKKTSPGQIKEAVSALAFAGIKTTTYWLIGYPGETGEDFQQTLDLIEILADDIYEADCNPFMFYLTGQSKSNQWRNEAKYKTLYPGTAADMLITQTWTLDGEPSREETYKRLNRFTGHCKKLGIPNPYSMYDIYQADERWKKLHRNAVPSLVDFEDNTTPINENKQVSPIVSVQYTGEEQGDFDF